MKKYQNEIVEVFAKLYVPRVSDKTSYLKRRKEWYSWQKRAAAVGLAQLPPHRPSRESLKMWRNSIIRLEEDKNNPKIITNKE